MASVPTITFSGTAISTFGAYLTGSPDGWLDAADVGVDATDLVGGIGGVVADTDTVKLRTVALDLTLYATTLSTLRGYEDTLKGYHRKDVTLRIADGVNTREIVGRCLVRTLRPYRMPVTLRTDARVTFLCADPTWKATSSTNESINGTPNSLSLGTAPVRDWVLTITATGGDITDVTITLGPWTLFYKGTIASTKSLIVTASPSFTVENDGSDDIANYTGGFPPVDPRDTPAVSATKASGSGTLGGSLVFYKRYW